MSRWGLLAVWLLWHLFFAMEIGPGFEKCAHLYGRIFLVSEPRNPLTTVVGVKIAQENF